MAALAKFFYFQSPDHLSELCLHNMRITEGVTAQLFDSLSDNFNLLKLKISGTSLNKTNSSALLVSFLRHNDAL